jgi:single-stranded-DNA-specific exonuclease
MAAGLTLRPEQVEAFRKRLNAVAHARIRADELRPALRLDFELTLGDLSTGLVTELRQLDPIGPGNGEVHTLVKGLELVEPPKRMGGEAQHARFRVKHGSAVAEAVWWNCAERPMPANRFDLAVSPQLNEYRGRTSVQLKVLDWRPSD